LNACVKAQGEAARETMKFIENVGLIRKEVDGSFVEEAAYLYFTYKKDGGYVTLSVPLLTIIPIPYIAIDYIDINFTCAVNGIESTNEEDTDNYNFKGEEAYKSKSLFGTRSYNFNTSVSNKRSSKSSQDSSYSIEATMDVSIHAKSDVMPAGMAKVLEMFATSIDYEYSNDKKE
jgi:hypothetical protein